MARHVVLHIGDTHLHPGPRQGDREDALEQILTRARALSTDGALALIVWPGDFFHQKSTPEDRNILARYLRAFAQLAPIAGVYGNHDVAGDLAVFTQLSALWPIVIVDSPKVVGLLTPTKLRMAVFCLPYPHRAGLASAGAAHASLVDEAAVALDAIFLKAAAELLEARGAGHVPLTIGHVNVGGSISSSGQPQIGQEIELSPVLIERLPSGPVALNHIHKHQRLQERAIYAGSIARMDFGEMEEKGFVEYTFDDQASQAQWTWRFVPIDVPRQVHVDGELTRDGFTPDAEIPDINGGDVRVRYRFVKADAAIVNLDHIRDLFPSARSLKLEGVPQLTHEMRAPAIAAAVTLDAKVAAYCELHGILVTDGLRGKLTALQSNDPAGLLTYVAQALTPASAAPAEQQVA